VSQYGMLGADIQSPVDVSYLADTVVLLRYFEADGEMRQAISIVKHRTGAHERSIRQFQMSSQGIAVGPPLRAFRGIFSGTPSYSAPLPPPKESTHDTA